MPHFFLLIDPHFLSEPAYEWKTIQVDPVSVFLEFFPERFQTGVESY